LKESKQGVETVITQQAAQPAEEKQEQVTQTIATKLSVQQAAKVMGVSARSVYNYIKAGQLAHERFGNMIIVDDANIRTLKRRPVGRTRTLMKYWHLPTTGNTQSLMVITVAVKEGQHEHLKTKIRDMQQKRIHLFEGTVTRYITVDDATNVHILLVWRACLAPSKVAIDEACRAFQEDFAETLDWESACSEEHTVLTHT
jgi:excisionase family DNA binding protein